MNSSPIAQRGKKTPSLNSRDDFVAIHLMFLDLKISAVESLAKIASYLLSSPTTCIRVKTQSVGTHFMFTNYSTFHQSIYFMYEIHTISSICYL